MLILQILLVYYYYQFFNYPHISIQKWTDEGDLKPKQTTQSTKIVFSVSLNVHSHVETLFGGFIDFFFTTIGKTANVTNAGWPPLLCFMSCTI